MLEKVRDDSEFWDLYYLILYFRFYILYFILFHLSNLYYKIPLTDHIIFWNSILKYDGWSVPERNGFCVTSEIWIQSLRAFAIAGLSIIHVFSLTSEREAQTLQIS